MRGELAARGVEGRNDVGRASARDDLVDGVGFLPLRSEIPRRGKVRRGKATRCRETEHDGGQATELRITTRLAGSR